MKEAYFKRRAKTVIGRYSSYSEFSKKATKGEKKAVMRGTLLRANKLQRQTAGIDK